MRMGVTTGKTGREGSMIKNQGARRHDAGNEYKKAFT